MLQKKNRYTAITALGAACVVVASLNGCARESSESLRAKATAYQQKGELNAATIVLKNAIEARPSDADARFQLATVYVDSGDGPSAEKEVRTAMRLGHAADTALPVLAKALLLQGQFQKVIDETEQAAPTAGPVLLCTRGDALMAMGKRDAAGKVYERVLQGRPGYAPALLGLGRLAYIERDLERARNYGGQALAAAPTAADALMFQGDLQRADNQPAAALATYDRVLALHPAHRTAHIEKAYLEITAGNFDAAKADLAAAAKTTPGSVLVVYSQALLEFAQDNNAAALASVQKVLRVAPEHMPSVLLAGAISLNMGSLYLAEQHLRHYLEANPDNLYARKLLASTLLRTGHSPDALTVLEPALKATDEDVQLLALAGESYMQARDFNKAADYFGKASSLEPQSADLRTSLALSKLGKGDSAQAVSELKSAARLDTKSPRAGMALVKAALQLQHIDEAYAAVVALEQAEPRNAAVQDLKGVVQIGKHDLAQARACFDKALVLQASYFPAAAHLAQLDMNEHAPARARQQLQDFLAKNKNSIDAMTALASVANQEHKTEEATRWLQQASAVDPEALGPATTLLVHYLQSGQNQKALELARKLQVTHPDDPDLLDLQGKSQLASGLASEALATYKTLAVTLPRSAQVQMQVAAVELLLKNSTEAENYLKVALALQPDFPAAQLALAELYVRKGWHELALMIASRMQRQHPQAAAGYQLEGDILMGQRKAALALPAYERAFGFSKTNELTIKVADALRGAGKREQAAQRLAQWTRGHPDDVRVQLYKAETLLADKQYAPAARQLEATLQQHGNDAVALNNLALAYQQLHDERAGKVAEQAWKLAPHHPQVMDTLGWILVERGDTARGVAILREAVAQSPEARNIRYHLAAGLYKTGDKAAARKELQPLVAGDMAFAQADETRALLKQLQ